MRPLFLSILSLIRALILGMGGVAAAFMCIPLFGLSLTTATILAAIGLFTGYVAVMPNKYQTIFSVLFISLFMGILVSGTLKILAKYGRAILVTAQGNPLSTQEIAIVLIGMGFYAVGAFLSLRMVGLDIHSESPEKKDHFSAGRNWRGYVFLAAKTFMVLSILFILIGLLSKMLGM